MNRQKQKWLWTLAAAAFLVPAAAAVCYKNVVITYTSGHRVQCSTFCVVDDSGWLCVQ
jgi:hypothetical protein